MLKSIKNVGTKRFPATKKVKDAVLKKIGDYRLSQLVGKQTVVRLIGNVIKTGARVPSGDIGSARDVDLVVFYNFRTGAIYEYLVVEFDDDTYVPRCAGANSNAANFREIGSLLDGGSYAELSDFLELMNDPEIGIFMFLPYGGVDILVGCNAHANTGKPAETSFYASLLKDANLYLEAQHSTIGAVVAANEIELYFSADGGASREDYDDLCNLTLTVWGKLDDDTSMGTVASAVHTLVVDEGREVKDISCRDVFNNI